MKVIFTNNRNKVAVWIGMVVLTATVLSSLMIGIGYKEVYIAYTGEQQLGVVYNKQQIENEYDQLKSQMMSIDPSLSFVEQPTLRL
ncbi:hypothetical protein PV433_11330 [Paenibacillus sp. GYB004]|uniref:hypothetical protein n=1 Tax=Paenibacillus sp. GYB004 TaxID=2994393 RepID=UPI002F9619B4